VATEVFSRGSSREEMQELNKLIHLVSFFLRISELYIGYAALSGRMTVKEGR
jgi:hypothetical protein